MGQSHQSPLDLAEVAAPANPAAGVLRVYAKNDDKIYTLTSAGVEVALGAGGAAAAVAQSSLSPAGNNTIAAASCAVVSDWFEINIGLVLDIGPLGVFEIT